MAVRGYRIPQIKGDLISYYDGSTLLGKRRVRRGRDVLHPVLTMPTKANKTFVGWSTSTSEDNLVSSLTANGQPRSLYAIYLDNTITVVSNGVITNSKYVSGGVAVAARASYNTNEDSTSFTLTKGKYGTATCVVYAEFSNPDSGGLEVGKATFDGSNILSDWITAGDSGSQTYTINSGGHSLYVLARSYDAYWQSGDVTVTSLVLSNPTAWT